MLSIRVMRRVGAWTLTEKFYVSEFQSCERCLKMIKEIWCVSVDALPELLGPLDGKKDWRVGNECGPKLTGAHAEVWKRETADAESRLDLLRRAAELLAKAKGVDHDRAEILAEIEGALPALADGTLRNRRRLTFIVGRVRREFGFKR